MRQISFAANWYGVSPENFVLASALANSRSIVEPENEFVCSEQEYDELVAMLSSTANKDAMRKILSIQTPWETD
jgi:uncharacterized protein (DUF1778 family)